MCQKERRICKLLQQGREKEKGDEMSSRKEEPPQPPISTSRHVPPERLFLLQSDPDLALFWLSRCSRRCGGVQLCDDHAVGTRTDDESIGRRICPELLEPLAGDLSPPELDGFGDGIEGSVVVVVVEWRVDAR